MHRSGVRPSVRPTVRPVGHMLSDSPAGSTNAASIRLGWPSVSRTDALVSSAIVTFHNAAELTHTALSSHFLLTVKSVNHLCQ